MSLRYTLKLAHATLTGTHLYNPYPQTLFDRMYSYPAECRSFQKGPHARNELHHQG